MTTYRVIGDAPVLVDGATHVHGDTVTTASDVSFLVQIGALAPVEGDEHPDGAAHEPLLAPAVSDDAGGDASEGVD